MEKKKIPNNNYAFIDGSFNQRTKTYGCGGFLIDQYGNKHIIQGSGSDPTMVSMRNIAGEILGAETAIELAINLGMNMLSLYHDYEGISKWPLYLWKANKQGTKDYVSFVCDAVKSGLTISFHLVKAHNGVPGNEEADQLAKQAVGIDK